MRSVWQSPILPLNHAIQTKKIFGHVDLILIAPGLESDYENIDYQYLAEGKHHTNYLWHVNLC